MRVAYVQLPRFPLQRLVLEQPSFAGKPVVLLEDVRGAERVRFVSRAASAAGVRLHQTGAAASATVPGLLKRRFDAAEEEKALRTLGESLLVVTPGFELDAPDGLWVDASAAHLAGGEQAFREELIARCGVAGFRARVAVGAERFSTQAICRFGTGAVLPAGGGAELAQTPLDALAGAGVGDAVLGPLKALGLTTLGEVAALPIGSLAARFGAEGHLVARLARGQDDSPLVPEVLPELIDEAVALDWPAEQLEPVLFAIKMVVDRVCARLQGRQRAAVRLTVGLTLEGQGLTALPLVLARPAAHSKLLLELIRHRLTDLSVRHPIAGVRVIVDEACPDPGRQLMLGDAPAGDAQLEVVLSKLQSALGEAALFSAEPLARHLPEAAWKLGPFRPPDAGRPSELWGAVDAGWTLGERRAPAPTEGQVLVRAAEDVRAKDPALASASRESPSRQGERAKDPALASASRESPSRLGERAQDPARELELRERKQTNAQFALLAPLAPPVAAPPEATPAPDVWAPKGRAAQGPHEAEVMDVIAGLEVGARWRAPKAKPVAEPLLLSATLEARPARLFQKPAPLHADLSPEGLLSHVTLQGRRRRVEAIEGPERLVGQWWSPEAVARDYYRVRLEGVGVLWVFKDGADGRFYAHGVFD
ncbi:MAG: DNA polymerase Y family protein [Myxococcaceae bacterium]|nr:DNA polymerase Y family protein [Myxococcaceae bacterium]